MSPFFFTIEETFVRCTCVRLDLKIEQLNYGFLPVYGKFTIVNHSTLIIQISRTAPLSRSNVKNVEMHKMRLV